MDKGFRDYDIALLWSVCVVSGVKPKEYVSLIIGLYKNNGSVLHVVIRLPYFCPLYLARTLIPNCMGSCHGQILIETETYS